MKKRMERSPAQQIMSRSKGPIVKDNLFTLSSFLNFAIAAALAAVGAYTNMLFTVIAIAQERKAKIAVMPCVSTMALPLLWEKPCRSGKCAGLELS